MDEVRRFTSAIRGARALESDHVEARRVFRNNILLKMQQQKHQESSAALCQDVYQRADMLSICETGFFSALTQTTQWWDEICHHAITQQMRREQAARELRAGGHDQSAHRMQRDRAEAKFIAHMNTQRWHNVQRAHDCESEVTRAEAVAAAVRAVVETTAQYIQFTQDHALDATHRAAVAPLVRASAAEEGDAAPEANAPAMPNPPQCVVRQLNIIAQLATTTHPHSTVVAHTTEDENAELARADASSLLTNPSSSSAAFPLLALTDTGSPRTDCHDECSTHEEANCIAALEVIFGGSRAAFAMSCNEFIELLSIMWQRLRPRAEVPRSLFDLTRVPVIVVNDSCAGRQGALLRQLCENYALRYVSAEDLVTRALQAEAALVAGASSSSSPPSPLALLGQEVRQQLVTGAAVGVETMAQLVVHEWQDVQRSALGTDDASSPVTAPCGVVSRSALLAEKSETSTGVDVVTQNVDAHRLSKDKRNSTTNVHGSDTATIAHPMGYDVNSSNDSNDDDNTSDNNDLRDKAGHGRESIEALPCRGMVLHGVVDTMALYKAIHDRLRPPPSPRYAHVASLWIHPTCHSFSHEAPFAAHPARERQASSCSKDDEEGLSDMAHDDDDTLPVSLQIRPVTMAEVPARKDVKSRPARRNVDLATLPPPDLPVVEDVRYPLRMARRFLQSATAELASYPELFAALIHMSCGVRDIFHQAVPPHGLPQPKEGEDATGAKDTDASALVGSNAHDTWNDVAKDGKRKSRVWEGARGAERVAPMPRTVFAQQRNWQALRHALRSHRTTLACVYELVSPPRHAVYKRQHSLRYVSAAGHRSRSSNNDNNVDAGHVASYNVSGDTADDSSEDASDESDEEDRKEEEEEEEEAKLAMVFDEVLSWFEDGLHLYDAHATSRAEVAILEERHRTQCAARAAERERLAAIYAERGVPLPPELEAAAEGGASEHTRSTAAAAPGANKHTIAKSSMSGCQTNNSAAAATPQATTAARVVVRRRRDIAEPVCALVLRSVEQMTALYRRVYGWTWGSLGQLAQWLPRYRRTAHARVRALCGGEDDPNDFSPPVILRSFIQSLSALPGLCRSEPRCKAELHVCVDELSHTLHQCAEWRRRRCRSRLGQLTDPSTVLKLWAGDVYRLGVLLAQVEGMRCITVCQLVMFYFTTALCEQASMPSGPGGAGVDGMAEKLAGAGGAGIHNAATSSHGTAAGTATNTAAAPTSTVTNDSETIAAAASAAATTASTHAGKDRKVGSGRAASPGTHGHTANSIAGSTLSSSSSSSSSTNNNNTNTRVADNSSDGNSSHAHGMGHGLNSSIHNLAAHTTHLAGDGIATGPANSSATSHPRPQHSRSGAEAVAAAGGADLEAMERLSEKSFRDAVQQLLQQLAQMVERWGVDNDWNSNASTLLPRDGDTISSSFRISDANNSISNNNNNSTAMNVSTNSSTTSRPATGLPTPSSNRGGPSSPVPPSTTRNSAGSSILGGTARSHGRASPITLSARRSATVRAKYIPLLQSELAQTTQRINCVWTYMSAVVRAGEDYLQRVRGELWALMQASFAAEAAAINAAVFELRCAIEEERVPPAMHLDCDSFGIVAGADAAKGVQKDRSDDDSAAFESTRDEEDVNAMLTIHNRPPAALSGSSFLTDVPVYTQLSQPVMRIHAGLTAARLMELTRAFRAMAPHYQLARDDFVMLVTLEDCNCCLTHMSHTNNTSAIRDSYSRYNFYDSYYSPMMSHDSSSTLPAMGSVSSTPPAVNAARREDGNGGEHRSGAVGDNIESRARRDGERGVDGDVGRKQSSNVHIATEDRQEQETQRMRVVGDVFDAFDVDGSGVVDFREIVMHLLFYAAAVQPVQPHGNRSTNIGTTGSSNLHERTRRRSSTTAGVAIPEMTLSELRATRRALGAQPLTWTEFDAASLPLSTHLTKERWAVYRCIVWGALHDPATERLDPWVLLYFMCSDMQPVRGVQKAFAAFSSSSSNDEIMNSCGADQEIENEKDDGLTESEMDRVFHTSAVNARALGRSDPFARSHLQLLFRCVDAEAAPTRGDGEVRLTFTQLCSTVVGRKLINRATMFRRKQWAPC